MKKPTKPKSQSATAASKKEKSLESAGTALLEGKPDKAQKILDAREKQPTPTQAVSILSEAHTIESEITEMDRRIEHAREVYKELKAARETLVARLRAEVRELGQGRLPFHETKGGEIDAARAGLNLISADDGDAEDEEALRA